MQITQKTRYSFCFYGHARTFRDNESLVHNLLNRYPGDTFIHIYPMKDIGPDQQCWHPDRAGQGDLISALDQKWICDTYPNIVDFQIDPLPYSTHYIPAYAQKFGGRHSGSVVQRMRREHAAKIGVAYDVVFRLRFDLVLLEPFVMPTSIDTNTLYGAYNLTAIEKGVDDDLFNYGAPRVIDGCFGTPIPENEIAKIPDYGFVGEALVTSIRKDHKFNYASHAPMKCGLLRSTGLMQIRI